MQITQSKTEFLTESLVEQLNDRWYVESLESESSYDYFAKAFIKPGRKYLKIMICDVNSKNADYNPRQNGRVYMFVEKETGFCYKPSSIKAPAKGVRFGIHQLANYPETCDKFGAFLYLR